MNPLHQSIQTFDRALRRPVLQAMPLEELAMTLADLDQFRLQADRHTLTGTDSRLVAAGCRLSSDLNEAVIERLIDTLQAQDHAIDVLSRQLRARMIERAETTRLLRKAQKLQQQIREAAETAGLV